MRYEEVLEYARELRKNQTEPEKIFWNLVRNRNFLGYKFNRQYIIKHSLTGLDKYFIVDFICQAKKLIIEIDGPYHEFQLAEDKDRDEILAIYGFKVIRFSNEDVEKNLRKVKMLLEKELES